MPWRISRLGGTSRLTTLLALQRFLPFQADDGNRNQRGGGVYPADMKHRIEDQAGKGYAGKVGTRISIRLSAPKAKSTGLRARHAEKRARAHRIQECLNPGPRAFKGGKQHVIAAIAEAHPNKTRFVLWPRREV